MLVDTDRQGQEDLLRLLRRYRLRQKIDIEDVSDRYRVWARFAATPAALRAPQPPGWAPDPRLWQLGLRAVLPVAGKVAGSSASSTTSSSSPEVPSSDSSSSGGGLDWRAHRHWRMLFGVAEGDSEIPSGTWAGGRWGGPPRAGG